MNILVTGAAGFIGSHLSEEILKCNKEYRVIGIDNLNPYYDVNLKKTRLKKLLKYKNFEFHHIDISNYDELNNLPINIEIIVNLAAQAGVRINDADHNKYVDYNVMGFLNIIMFAKKANIKNIVYASSSSVYSGLPNHISVFKEDLRLETPNSMYAITKLTNEMQANLYSKRLDISFVGLRFFTVYGNYGRPDMAYFSFSESLRQNREITLFNGGDMSRDMTHVSDIVKGIISSMKYILNKNEVINEIFNLGNDRPVKTTYLLELISNALQTEPLIFSKNSKNEVLHTHADLSKSSHYLEYKPKINVEEGIEMFIEWFKLFTNFNK